MNRSVTKYWSQNRPATVISDPDEEDCTEKVMYMQHYKLKPNFQFTNIITHNYALLNKKEEVDILNYESIDIFIVRFICS
jgi:hypothetical protein